MNFFTSDGLRIAFYDEGRGDPILLIHGFASNSSINWIFPGWVKTLVDDGRRVIAIESMRFAGRFLPKPSRSMLAKLIARLRVPRSCCVLVEDSPENLRAARACGLATVLVTGVAYRRHAVARRPRAGRGRRIDVQVQSIWDLPRIVHRIR